MRNLEAEIITEYSLYLESGPKRRKTMVHALDLLGCIAQGASTEEALEATPAAIRAYLRLMRSAGEEVDPDAPFTTAIAAHVMEGSWIGNGDPSSGFAPDFQPLTAEDLALYLPRLDAMQTSLLAIVRDLPQLTLAADPPGGGRSVFHILEHLADSHAAYLRYTSGKIEGLAGAQRALRERPEDPAAALERVWAIARARTASLTEAERTQPVQHGQLTWTARRALRRMLEHTWEHCRELERRLGAA